MENLGALGPVLISFKMRSESPQPRRPKPVASQNWGIKGQWKRKWKLLYSYWVYIGAT